MEEHPYRKNVAGLDPRTVLAETPQRLRALFDPLSPTEIDAVPGPGKWSLRELMSHLADAEIAWSFRLRQVLAGEPTLQAFDQDRWATRYTHTTFADAQRTWEALRAWNLTLLSTLRPGEELLPVHHPRYGDMNLQHLLEFIAGHDVHHLQLLDSKLGKQQAQAQQQAVPSPS